jgi:SEC-C motif
MAAISRNAPCPCGSALKYKRCCLERDRELERQAEALEELLALPSVFPLLRPLDSRFEAWTASVGEAAPTRELVEAGLDRLGRRERRRIVSAAEALVGELDEVERHAVLVGAVVGALGETGELDPASLDHLEECEDCREGPAEALAAVLEPCDLWSFDEADRAVEELDRVHEALAGQAAFAVMLGVQAGSMWSREHTRRLELLVDRVRAQLPVVGRPLASAALADACAAVQREQGVRMRLAGLLLADALGPARLLRLAA